MNNPNFHKQKIEILNQTVKSLWQVKKPSLLPAYISEATGCQIVQAEEWAKTHCNTTSLYGILYASLSYHGTYADFFGELLNNNMCRADGYTLKTKKQILDHFEIESELKTFYNYSVLENPAEYLDPEKFYQLRIANGGHFTDGYQDDEVLYITDTMNRGNPVKAVDVIIQSEFKWIMEIC